MFLISSGLVVDTNNVITLATDGKPYLIIGYANGPGYGYHRTEDGEEVPRDDLSNTTTTGKYLLGSL